MTRLAILALAVAACSGDPCNEGDTECVDDHSIRECVGTQDGWSVDLDWVTQDCTAPNPACVTRELRPNVAPQYGGLCATAQTQSPLCGGTVAGYCTEGARYACFDGYSVLQQYCPSGCSTSSPELFGMPDELLELYRWCDGGDFAVGDRQFAPMLRVKEIREYMIAYVLSTCCLAASRSQWTGAGAST